MLTDFATHPGRLYVVATLLPLAAFAGLFAVGTVRRLARPTRHDSGRLAAFVVLASLAASAALGITGLIAFLNDPTHDPVRWSERTDWLRIGRVSTPASALELGYRIDHLTAVLFAMVTVVGTLIVLFSLGYMRGELAAGVEDHEADAQNHARTPVPLGGGHDTTPPAFSAHGVDAGHHAHSRRPGRFGRFFLYLSLFAGAMLNLLIADNLLQVFVSWELVGACSFFLIGFYHERPSAARAATKAFVVNRIGDAGFLVGIFIAWSTFGTLNIDELCRRVQDGGAMSHTVFVLMGAGLFLGCVGKSAQLPLHTWLPDAMEGPTPVSALIHAATMVAAGVYLVGRCYALFAPEVLLGIAYVGAATLFMAATIAVVMTDIKRVLAYSTVSQLGYMMLALGVGGWVAGLLHLLTHAFFKALLFLAAGSVIFGCHHEQDLRKMGGLRRKMPVTAVAMLVGVLAIVGTPFFSGWYSKDQVLVAALGYGLAHEQHAALFVLPFVTAGLTGFYMFRLWLLAFTGTPRDSLVHDHAHESPRVMTRPLIVLAAFSVGVAWGWPPWDAEASAVGHLLHEAEPATVAAQSAAAKAEGEHHHVLAGGLPLLAAAAGAGLAVVRYRVPRVNPDAGRRPGFLTHRWYFDEIYNALVVRPTIAIARLAGAVDRRSAPSTDRVDGRTLDGLLNAVGQAAAAVGRGLGRVQTGWLRGYVLALALTAAVMLGILTALAK